MMTDERSSTAFADPPPTKAVSDGGVRGVMEAAPRPTGGFFARRQTIDISTATTTKDQAIAKVTNAVAAPGPLTSEWWSVLLAGLITALLAIFKVSNNDAQQIAAEAAPVALAVIYAFARAHTKGALGDVLKEIFPQEETPVDESGAAATNGQGPNGATASGAAPVTTNDLVQLAALLQQGLITREEFDSAKAKLFSTL